MRAPLVLAVLSLSTFQQTPPDRLDREALVRRHAPTLTTLDVEAPLTVGNGEFAFTADATGLQTFPELYADTIPLATQSQWGWHSAPNPEGWSMARYPHVPFDSYGRQVGYADIPGDRRTPEVAWLRANPHRLHLGRVGFRLQHADGRPAVPADVTEIHQTLDLWRGMLVSTFAFDGERVDVETAVHPASDVLAVRVQSALAADGRLAVELRFPYGTGHATAADWTRPEAHATWFRMGGRNAAIIERRLDADRYFVVARWSEGARVNAAERHVITVVAAPGSRKLSLAAEFVPGRAGPALDTEDVLAAAAEHWRTFWSTGGAIDLSRSRDPRWRELERRIVLSQYLTAVNGAGRYPPQETGLTFNSWEGKFHLEMHWWHVVHFAQWGRLPLLERSLGYYDAILPTARATAARQGYRGARWPKMTSPTGDESPSTIGPFLVWQQPHPIYFAELVHRQRPTRETLERFRTVVFETAEFMASFAARDRRAPAVAAGAAQVGLTLGPPLHCAQEVFPKETTTGCSYELAYWRWGLEAAQRWRVRIGLPRSPDWDAVLRDLEAPATAGGRYLFANSRPDSYTDRRWSRDHPSVLAMLGVLPGEGIDRGAMRRTFDWIWSSWQWADTWGWDYPMTAMTAARLGDPARAIDALLLDTPKNRYRVNGHNHQRPGLTIYLPGNGGLLSATALMAAGWDGAPPGHAPGFPADGSWTVRWEGLLPLP